MDERKPGDQFAIAALGWLALMAGLLGLFLPLLPGVVLILFGSSLLGNRLSALRGAVNKCRKRVPIANRILSSTERIEEQPARETARGGMPKLLIFDQDIQHLARCAEPFEAQGVEVHKCTSVESAMRCIEREEFDLALVDQVSPAFEGRRVIRHLARYNWPIPFIVLAERKNKECFRQALEAGAVEYLEKPVSRREIGTVIERLFVHVSVEVPESYCTRHKTASANRFTSDMSL